MSQSNLGRFPKVWVDTLEARRLLTTLPLDSGFGFVGAVSTSIGTGTSLAETVAVQADGKIVVAGYAQQTVSGNDTTVIVVVRYNTNGSLDDGSASDLTPKDSFGVGGIATIAFSQYGQFANKVAIQSDGKIVVAGQVNAANSAYLIFARLNADGSRDKTFGRQGIFTAFAGDDARLTDITLQPDGKIVAVGSMGGNWLVSRLTTAGAFDATFHSVGFRSLDFGGVNESAKGVAIDNVGNILVGGTSGDGNAALATLVRLGPTGDYDAHFGIGGISSSIFVGAYGDSVNAMGWFPNGQSVLVGTLEDKNSITGDTYIEGAQFNFSTSGTSGGGALDDINQTAVAVSPLGGFAIIGSGAYNADTATAHILSRTPDYAVSTNYTPIYRGTLAYVIDAAYAPSGKLIVVGARKVNGVTTFTTTCYDDVDAAQRGSVSGVVFNDANANGLQDKNEKGQANVRVYIDTKDDGTYSSGGTIDYDKSVLTDSSGRFTIAGVTPGTWMVRQQTPSGYERTTTSEKFAVTVVAAHTAAGVVFGNRLVGSAPIANGFASLANGVLTLQGTGEADQIGISYKKGNLNFSVDGENQSVLLSLVSKIVITTLGGNDTIRLAGTVHVAANIDGGAGDDSIVGGPLADTINGGAGNDVIVGGAGDDRLAGGDGNDTILGGDGRDRISAQDGDDSVTGDAGRDVISGGNGNDTLIGGASADALYGNAGNDILNGLSGADALDGGDDTDTARLDNLDTRVAIEVLV